MGVNRPAPIQGEDVVVLARNFRLSEPQYNLLSRGLSFISTTTMGREEEFQLQLDTQNYHRKIKLASYFQNVAGREMVPFVGSSNWMPPLHKLPLEVQDLISKDLETFKTHYKPIGEKPNLSACEARALRELQAAKHIVIKPADKGSAVVILSREQYVFEVKRQLNDAQYYRKLEKPIYLETIPMVANILETLKKKKFITEKQRKYLIGELQPRERRFYILPKIHKDPTQWTVPFEIPPGRPIVSDCGSETYFTAEFLDHFLNPLSCIHPSYVRDTYHFIDIIKNLTIPPEFLFFSMDVENLYTNIPIQEGMECVRKIFAEYPDPKRPDEELLSLLEINLTRNDFVFNEEFYLQIKGTAMGKKFAPAYANIFMADWERGALAKCRVKPVCYLRYLDDIFGIWVGLEEEFKEFVNILNCHDPSIKLKTELNPTSINFLDTTIFKGPDFTSNLQLDIKVFFKPTDSHALLHKKSFHPKHTFKGIVKSQILRFKRICTREEDFWQAVHVLFGALKKRGYCRSFLKNCLKTFEDKGVSTDDSSFSIIPLISTFSSAGTVLNKKYKCNFENILSKNDVIPNSRVISAYRRNKNLGDLLVRAKLPALVVAKSLSLEAQFSRIKFVRNSKTKIMYRIRQGFSPRSSNMVYLIFCSKCHMQYVGETKNMLATRMAQHQYNIRNRRETNTPLVKHFIEHGLASLRVAGLQRDNNWTDWDRKKREKHWIFLLGTKQPYGLNVRYF